LSASLFCVSAYSYYYWFRNSRTADRASSNSAAVRIRERRNRRRRRRVDNGTSDDDALGSSDDECDTDDIGGRGAGGAPILGRRGHAALDRPAVPYLDQFLHCLENLCDPLSNPMGCIPLCVAENRLVLDMITHKFVQMTTASAIAPAATTTANGGGDTSNAAAAPAATSTSPFADPRTYCYNSFLGMPVARDAAAYFIARHLLFGGGGGGGHHPTDSGTNGVALDGVNDGMPHDDDVSPDAALEAVRPSHVVLATGAAALLSHLFVLLGNSSAAHKECCLIPAPYYAAFDNHCRLVPDVEPFGIVQTNPLLGPTDADLNKAYRQAQQVRSTFLSMVPLRACTSPTLSS
jgi:hypothetical protein